VVLVLTETDLDNLVSMGSAVESLERAFREQSEGRVLLPERQFIQQDNSDAIVRIMVASAPSLQALGLKALLGKPAIRRDGLTYFVVLLFNPEDASLLAIISAKRLTQLRTGATSGVATKYLARSDSKRIGLVGAGVQGFGQLEGVAAVANLRGGIVFDPNDRNATTMIEKAQSRFGLKLERRSNLDDIYDVDILCTATTSVKPLIFGDKLRPGMHINAIGSNAPNRQEVHESALLRSKVFVDRREQALSESGDFVVPSSQGRYDAGLIKAELCDVVNQRVEGRTSGEDITLFKSVGIAIEDIAVARLAYDVAVLSGVGKEIRLQ
jgi:alanine dehydrogenase